MIVDATLGGSDRPPPAFMTGNHPGNSTLVNGEPAPIAEGATRMVPSVFDTAPGVRRCQTCGRLTAGIGVDRAIARTIDFKEVLCSALLSELFAP